MPETTETMRNRPLNHINEGTMQEYDYNVQTYEQDRFYYPKNYKGIPGVVLRTADAYADQINMEKNNSMTGSNTVIYRNFL